MNSYILPIAVGKSDIKGRYTGLALVATTSSNFKMPVHPREPAVPEDLWDSRDIKGGYA